MCVAAGVYERDRGVDLRRDSCGRAASLFPQLCTNGSYAEDLIAQEALDQRMIDGAQCAVGYRFPFTTYGLASLLGTRRLYDRQQI